MTKLIYNSRIYLGGNSFCKALIIKNGRILKTGSSRDLLEEASGAEKIDAEGALILPAFNDSHIHLLWTAQRASGIEAAGAKSIEEIIRRGREKTASLKPPSGAYILGDGVNPDLFSEGEKRDPRREDLDKISTEHPLVMNRHCGHTIYCNSLALKLAGFSESAPNVEGGTFEKDNSGKPTGVLRENAASLLSSKIPAPSLEELKKIFLLAMKKAQSLGITSAGSCDTTGPDFEDILQVYKDIFHESREAGVPALRINMQTGISAREDMLDAHLNRGIYLKPLWEDPEWGCFLKMGSIKIFGDGSLGGRTAYMRQPYKDKPETSGFPVLDQETLNHFVKKAAAGGMQVLIHEIGDAGMVAALRAFENVTSPGRNPLRHGIVHCQITTPDLLERMSRNQILAIVQPIFLSDDRHILESRVGQELASTSYAWNSMHKLGIPVSYSTDSPVSTIDPLLNIQWAVLRADSGSSSLYPDERVDIQTAVDAYTRASAFSAFDESSLGCIAPGYLADLVFLDQDLFNIEPEEIHKTKVLRTLCAGETVYRA